MTDEDKKLLDEWRAVERELYKRIWFYGEFGKLLFRSTKCGRR
jgi:hypothetical protein